MLAVSLFGVADEFRQSFTPGRSVEFADWVADSLGAGAGVLLYTFWPFYRRLLEWRIFGRPRGTAVVASPEASTAQISVPSS